MRFVLALIAGLAIGFVMMSVPSNVNIAAVAAITTTIVLFAESTIMHKLEDIEAKLEKKN